MVRVAVIGTEAAAWPVLAARLRHACVERWEESGAKDWDAADAVAILGEAPADREVVESALAGGRQVLLATHWAPELATLERWFALAQAHRVRLDVVNPQFARPSRRLIRQQIDNGKLGDVGLLRISRTVTFDSTASGDHRPQPMTAPAMVDVDLAVWLIGRAPDRVFAIRRRIDTTAPRVSECLHVHLGFAGGNSALIMATTAAPGGNPTESLSVIARSGAAYADDHQNRQLLIHAGATTAPPADEGDGTATLLDEFALRIRGEFDPACELRRWRQLTMIAAAVDQSAASQQAIALELN